MIRELNSRSTSYGLFVLLLWDDETGETIIEMESEEGFDRFIVAGDDAASAFAHPFVFRCNSVHIDAEGTRLEAFDPDYPRHLAGQ